MAFLVVKTSSTSGGSNPFFSIPPPSLKISRTCSLSLSYRSDFMDFMHIQENRNIQDIRIPDIKPYNYKPSSFFKTLKTLLTPSKKPKESVQLTPFSEHPIPSDTLKIPAQSPPQGYAYVHVGAIRLALTFHNKKGLPVATRIALLDSRNKNYQHACLAMVETTIHYGTIVVTVFPNITMSTKDKTWSTTFVVQIQMVGAPMDPGLVQATLYSQMAYRLQDHVHGLGFASYEGIPLVQAEPHRSPITIHIPASISRQELVSLLPEAWVSKYENRRKEEEEQTNRNTNAVIGNALVEVLPSVS